MSGDLRTEVAKKLSALNEPDGSEDMWPSYLEDADAAIAIVLERAAEVAEGFTRLTPDQAKHYGDGPLLIGSAIRNLQGKQG